MAKKKPATPKTVSKSKAPKGQPEDDGDTHGTPTKPLRDADEPVSNAATKQDEKTENTEDGPQATQSSQPDSNKNLRDRFQQKPKDAHQENDRPEDGHAGTDADSTHTTKATQATATDDNKNRGDVALTVAESGAFPGEELLESTSRARLNGEKRHEYWERMRKSARLAGLPRGQLAGSAYVWATEQTEREFPPPVPVIVEELPSEPEPEPIPEPPKPVPEVIAAPVQADGSVSGLDDIPDSWGELPDNASLQVEIAWVSANRLRVRSGSGVDLSRAKNPAPSYAALSWLETSILFPAKFADISVKATAETDDEKEFIKREKFAIEEIRGILKEMLDAQK
jgi:hypothetical protein